MTLDIGEIWVVVDVWDEPVASCHGGYYAAKSKFLNASLNFSTSCSS